ncbi:MAG: methylated-DNA--[protein]-cysteine S-methyltransferase [Sporichthyaceae bacterium]
MLFTEAGDRCHAVVDSPLGAITLVADRDVLCALYMTEHRHAPQPEAFGPPEPEHPVLAKTAVQLAEYFAGTRTVFDLPLDTSIGTPFQRTVWAALLEIPYGETWSYGELARHIGQPTASRAVGLANGKNPISIVVPCHRVIGSGGSLTGYGGGLERKQYLLALERRTAAPAEQLTLG